MGRPCRKGPRLPTPRELFDDTAQFPAAVADYAFPGGTRPLRTQEVTDVLWYAASREQRQRLVLVRDPTGQWRDLALLCTDTAMNAAEAVEGYCRRWSIELTFHDSKQYLGLSDPQVRTAASVTRAHTVAYWCYSLTILWYAEQQEQAAPLQRQRPWYKPHAGPTFTDMLGTLRLALWQGRIFGAAGASGQAHPHAENLQTLLHFLAAVR